MERKPEYPVTALRICIDNVSLNGGEIKGRICGVALDKEYPFTGSSELLLLIDKLLDKIGKPQASRKVRSFREVDEVPASGYQGNPVRYYETEEIAAKKGEFCTRDVFFISRMRSTWQGFLKKEDGTTLGEFDSDLEFLNLLLYDHRVTDKVHNKNIAESKEDK